MKYIIGWTPLFFFFQLPPECRQTYAQDFSGFCLITAA